SRDWSSDVCSSDLAMNLAGGGSFWLPLPLIPVVGALTGLAFAALIGYIITRISGVAFAMITLAIGQMAYASALMFPGFFGGEGGVSTNRVYDESVLGWNFGPQKIGRASCRERV